MVYYMLPRPKICEGQKVPHAHKDDALEYRYVGADMVGMICSRCASLDRARGYILERTFSEEEDDE